MNLAEPQIAPPRQSEEPEMPFVREWMTTSAPKRAWRFGGGGGGVFRQKELSFFQQKQRQRTRKHNGAKKKKLFLLTGVTAMGANVLSTTNVAPCLLAIPASAGKSATASVGFASVSA